MASEIFIPAWALNSENPYVEQAGILIPAALLKALGATDANQPLGAPIIAGFNADGSVSVQPVMAANARVTAGGPAPGQTAILFAGTIAGTGSQQTVPLGTVVTGKTRYYTDVHVAIQGGPANGVIALLQSASVTIMPCATNNTKPFDAWGIETQPQATSGQVQQLVLPAATGATYAYFFGGIEQ